MSKKVVILNGSGGVGKDEFVKQCSKFIATQHISSVDEIKQIAKKMGWMGEKTEESRLFLSNLKDLHTEYCDGPFTYIMGKITEFQKFEQGPKILFIDVREPREIEKLVKECWLNIETVLVVNDNVERITSNHADDEVFDYKYDWVIDNNGDLEQLECTVNTFIYHLFN